jgi:signal transduction histidine kinase/ActR/RegA family two-component response regulator
MTWLQDIPIKRKLTLVILLTCTAVLLLACSVLAAYQMFDFQRTTVRNMTVLADVFAKNSRAALQFQDADSARETLLALQIEPAVEAACLYNANGGVFTDYIRAESNIQLPASPGADGHRYENSRLVLSRPVLSANGKRIGTMYLQTDLRGVHERLALFGVIAAIVLLGSLLVAFAISSRLQRPISGPILALAKTARRVAEQKDFTVRVPAQGKNEIGMLTAAFNQMLGGIEERESALRGEIAERQYAEKKVQAQLARLELLNQITRSIGDRLDLGGIFQTALKNLEEHLPVDFGSVCIYDAAENVLSVSSIGAQSQALAPDLEMREQTQIGIDQNGLSRCVRGQLVYEPDVTQVEFPFPQRLARGGLRALVLAPVLVESQVFGVVVAARKSPESFSSGECEFLRQLSEHIALATHQSQLYTALQKAYDELRQSQQTVLQQERLRALGQMASGIAHDINNAISPVGIYAEALLEDEPNLSERARDYLTTIQRAIGDVAQTVSRMGEFYRQRREQLVLAPVQLNSLVPQVIDLTRARWNDMPQQRGIMINMETDLAKDPPAVMGVESEIREALINLVFNAVDAMPEGGTLTLRTKVMERDASADGASKRVCIQVSDTGFGMSEETRKRCLEPFFTTKGERGSGLGLAMVYGIAQRHSADLEIESAPGKGTAIGLSFPVPSGVLTDPGQSSAGFVVPSRLRILVVDDDPLLIKSLRDCLEGDGHVVTTANGGQAGIDAFRSARENGETFAVVVTDLGMPYVDGRRVSSAIKQMSPATPVILLTGWGQRIIADRDVPSSVDRVLSKPPKLRDLREALAHLCQTAKADKTNAT